MTFSLYKARVECYFVLAPFMAIGVPQHEEAVFMGFVTDKELIGGTKSAGVVTISDSWDPDMERQPFSNA